MKSYLKLLMAMLLVLTCFVVFTACFTPVGNPDVDNPGDNSGDNDNPNPDDGGNTPPAGDEDEGEDDKPPVVIVPPATDPVEETYLVQFVYRYFLTYVNDFDRMESKEFVERKITFDIPVENNGFTAEQLAQIADISHNGYSFADWYVGWDENNYTVAGDPFDFAQASGPITSDMVFYGYRGNLAGKDATWAITEEGEGKTKEVVLTISGTGETFNFTTLSNIDIPWYAERSKITKIVIEEGITSIGDNCFNSLYGVDEISFPSTLESVGTSSFRGMTKLTSLVTPANLKVIGSNAFAETSLKSVVFNEGLEIIGNAAFSQSNKIVSVIIPSTLKEVKDAAFYPGSVDGKLNGSALKTVFSRGTAGQFGGVTIGLDNTWFNELASVYFTPEEGVDPLVTPGAYWRYEGEEAVPYYFMIKYVLNSSVYGIKTPIFVDYVPTTYSVGEDGTTKLEGKATAANVAFTDSIVYHNYKFVRFSNAVSVGLVLTEDRTVTCEVYSNTRVTPSATATGSNKGHLSNKGGIVWEFNFGQRTLTVSLAAKVADVDNILALLKASYPAYKGTLDANTALADVLGIKSAADLEIVKELGFTSADDFLTLSAKLAALEIASSIDPLIATADKLAAAGVVTAEDLAAFAASLEAAAIDADLQAKLAATTLDSQNVKDLAKKVADAKITGNISDEFKSIQNYLKAFEDKKVSLSDIAGQFAARTAAIEALAKATVKDFYVGNAEAYDAAVTVADFVDAVAALQDADGIFKTWDYATSEDTSVMWASSRQYTDYVQKIVIGDGIKHIGSFAFAALPSLEEIVIPASVESIDTNAFDGCSVLKNVYCDGTSLSAIQVLDAKGGAEAKTLADNEALTGHYADIYAKVGEDASGEGKFWAEVNDSKIAWSITGSTLKIGGSPVMVDFASVEDTPWYSAKDSVTKVIISKNIKAIGENIVNGFENVVELDLGEGFTNLQVIPASAFAGTGVVNNEDNYNNRGLLIINDEFLIASKSEAELVEVPIFTAAIAEGVFDNNPNLKYIAIPKTVNYLPANLFSNVVPTIIYYDGSSTDWNNIAYDLEMPEGAEYYVALTNISSTDNTDFFFHYKKEKGQYILLAGCIHEYSDWTVTKEPTCTVAGMRERACLGDCGKTFTEEVPFLGHDWTAWTPCEDAPTYEERFCQRTGCDGLCAVENCTVHVEGSTIVAHEKHMINSEYTFEGIEAVPEHQIKLSDTTNSTYSIVEIGTDAHAFEYEKTGKGVSAEFTVYATQAGTLDSAKAVVYNSDLKIDNLNKKVSIDLVFRSELDPSKKVMALNILSTDGKTLNIGARSSYAEDAIVADYVALGVKTGEWFNLRVEYYADATVGVAKVYVDDTLVYVTDVYFGSEVEGAAPGSAGLADSMSFVPSSNYLGKISLDNVTLTQTDEYVFDGVTTLVRTLNYDELPATSLVKIDGTATIVEKDGNKYLSLNRASTSTGYFTFYPTSKADGANAAIFETKVQITRTAGSRAFAIRFRGGNNGGSAYMLEFRHDANTQTLYVADKSESQDAIGYKSEYIQPTDKDGNKVDIQVGDWYTIRVEYYDAKVGDAESVRMLTYINDVLVLYSNNWYGVTTEQENTGAGTVPHPVTVGEFTDVYIQPYTSHRGEWNVDDTTFYTTIRTAPTAPIELKYDDYNGGAIDNGGVIRTDWVQQDDRAKALKNLVNVDAPSDEEDDIFVPDAPVKNGPVTFDKLEALPENIRLNSGNGTLVIAEENGNKFFRVNEGTSSTRFQIGLTEEKVENATSVIFEAKMRYNISRDGGNGGTNMFFTKDGDTSSRAFEFQFNYTGGNVMISTREGTQKDGTATTQPDFATDVVDTGIAINTWFTIKLEYTDEGKLIVHIDGKKVLESDNFYNKFEGAVDASEVADTWFVPFGSTVGNIDFDDLSFYQAIPEEDNSVKFDDLEALPENIRLNSGNGTLVIAEEDGNKFFRVNEGTSSTRFQIGLTEEKVENAASVIFKAKMRYNISRDGGNGGTNMFFTKEGDTSSRAFEFQFNYTGGNVMISTREGTQKDGTATTQPDFATDAVDTGIAINTWFDIMLEYTDAGKLIVHINGNKVLESDNFYNKFEGAYDASVVADTWFVPFGSTVGYIDFDNLSFYQVAAEEVTPEIPDTPAEPEVPVDPKPAAPIGSITFDGATGFPVSSAGSNVEIVNESQTGQAQYTNAEGAKEKLWYDEAMTKPVPQFKGTVSIDKGYLSIVDVSAKSLTIATTDKEAAMKEDLGQAIIRFNLKGDALGNVGVFQSTMRLSPLEDGTSNMVNSGAGYDIRFNSTGNKNAMAAFVYAKNGFVAICDKSSSSNEAITTAKIGEWFNLTYVYEYDAASSTSTGKVIVTDIEGVETILNVTTNNAPAADLYRVSVIGNKPFQGIIDFDNIYVGEKIEYPAADEEKPEAPEYPDGTATFDDIAAGEWGLGSVSNLSMGVGKQAHPIFSTTIVSENGMKYLSFSKSGVTVEGSSTAMAWLSIENTTPVAAGTNILFETKMRFTKLGGNNETHIRLYNGRSGATASGGTEIGGSATRIKIKDASGVLEVAGKSTGIAVTDWFTLKILASGSIVSVIVIDANGTETEVAKLSNEDFVNLTTVQFTNASKDLATFDFDWIYFGAEPVDAAPEEPDAPEVEEPEEDEGEEVLPGTNTFENAPEGLYAFDNTAAVKVNHIINGANAVGETKIIVDENGNKYFSMIKSKGASGSAQTWLVVERTMEVPEGTPIVFEADMRIAFTNGSSAYLRFYKNRPAETGTGGTIFGSNNAKDPTVHQNIMFNYQSGSLTLDANSSADFVPVDLGVKKGEWFTLRFVMSGTTIQVYVADAEGKFQHKGDIVRTGWADLKDLTSIVYMNDSSCTMTVDLDNVYFGAYVADVESPIENLPAKDSKLPAGAETFDSLEAAALPEEIVYLNGANDSTLGAVAVSRANKVLYFDKNAESNAYFYFNATEKNVGASKLSFETQMYFDKVDAAGYVDFTLMPAGAAAEDRVYKVRLITDGTKLSVAPVALVDGADVVGEAVELTATVGKWFKLSIEYTESEKIVVSVDGTAVITGTAAYGMFKDAAAVSQVLVAPNAALAADIYFENMSLSQLAK